VQVAVPVVLCDGGGSDNRRLFFVALFQLNYL
jgi:hypothetical protein